MSAKPVPTKRTPRVEKHAHRIVLKQIIGNLLIVLKSPRMLVLGKGRFGVQALSRVLARIVQNAVATPFDKKTNRVVGP